jgi:tetratricopeptide (TPR) repeat protein
MIFPNVMVRRVTVVLSAIIFASCALTVSAQNRRPASGAAQIRTINVVTEPDASVWIDGVLYGKTNGVGNLTITTLSSGVHSLRVRANGFKEITQPITAVQKGDIEVNLVKTTDPGELAFQKAEGLLSVDRDKAAEAYREAINLRPKYADAYLGLARVSLELGDFEAATAAIAGARRARPGYPEATAVEGRILKESGEEAKAIAAFKRAITEGKGFQPEAYTGLGLLYKEKAEGSGGDLENEELNYAEAAKNLRIALKQLSGAPDTIVIYQLLGLIYERTNKFDDAIAIYEEFLRIFPDTPEATAVRSFIVQIRKQMAQQD